MKVRCPHIPSQKITTFFFSCAVASVSYCQEASFGTETGHVGSQWLISSHCTLSAFSLNYLRQTSWLAATQTSGGLSRRRPEFGSHEVSDEERKRNPISAGASPVLVSPLEINRMVDRWFWVVRYVLEFSDVNLGCLGFRRSNVSEEV